MPAPPVDPERLALEALADPETVEALREAAERGERLSLAVEASHPEVRLLAEEVRKAKEEALARLDMYVDMFREAAERLGARVHLAATPGEAVEIVSGIVGSGKTVVMSKSMVAEEVGLREELEKLGNEVWETDLGQLLVQLERGKPQHPIAPAVHLSRRRAARLLRDRLGLPVDESTPVEEMVSQVRRFLREKIVSADVGVTGVNAAAADTGSLVMVENESNIRLVSSLPPVHVAVTGVEKIMPTLLLAIKAALVQAAYAGLYPPTYLNIVSGPSSTADIGHQRVRPAQGPRELHVVLVDNGRRRARGTFLEPVLRCIRCGRCLFSCPVWRVLGGRWGGRVYVGPMGLPWTAVTGDPGTASAMAFLCLQCSRCDEACPMKIPLTSIIRSLRRQLNP